MRIGKLHFAFVLFASVCSAQLVPVWEWTVSPCPALKPGETQEDRARRCGRYEFYQPRDNIRFVSEGKWIDAIIPEFPDLTELQRQIVSLQQQNAALEKRVTDLESKIIPLPTPAMARCIHEHLIVPLVARDRGGRTQEDDFKNCIAALQQEGEAAVSLSRASHQGDGNTRPPSIEENQ